MNENEQTIMDEYKSRNREVADKMQDSTKYPSNSYTFEPLATHNGFRNGTNETHAKLSNEMDFCNTQTTSRFASDFVNFNLLCKLTDFIHIKF